MAIMIGSNFSVNTNLHIDDRSIMATLVARDAILQGRRYLGMNVFVEENSTNYQLLGGLSNTNWVKVSDESGSYTHPSTDGALHVPATGTTSNGKVLMAGSTSGSMTWTTLPAASTIKSGIVTLTSALNLDDETKAATAKAVKTLQDSKLEKTEVTETATAHKVLKLNADAKMVVDVVGNSSTATSLANARDIAISGDSSGTASFNGTSNINISTTLKDSGVTAGEYTRINVNSKGIVTGASLLAIEDLGSEAVTVGTIAPADSRGIWFQIEE